MIYMSSTDQINKVGIRERIMRVTACANSQHGVRMRVIYGRDIGTTT